MGHVDRATAAAELPTAATPHPPRKFDQVLAIVLGAALVVFGVAYTRSAAAPARR